MADSKSGRRVRDDEHVADTALHLCVDLLAEPAGPNGCVARHHPCLVADPSPPGCRHRIHLDADLKMQLESSRLARDPTHTREQLTRHDAMAVESDIDDAVIRRHKKTGSGTEALDKTMHSRIHRFHRVGVRRPVCTATVRGDVGLRRIDVDEAGARLARRRESDCDPILK